MNTISEVIEFYEAERKNLNDLIEDFVDEREFQMAHFHQKALNDISKTISILKKLESPVYADIEQLQQRLDNITSKQFLKLLTMPTMANYWEAERGRIKNKIDVLQKLPRENQIDGQEFDELIYKLVCNDITHFRFCLSSENKIYLNFIKSNSHILISILSYNKLIEYEFINKISESALKKIGFVKNEQSDMLTCTYDLLQFKNALEIKEITSLVIYEIFGLYLDKDSFFEIIN